MPKRRGWLEIAAIVWLSLAILATVASLVFGGWLDPSINLAEAQMRPALHHWLGTDELGRDVLLRVLQAGRSTLLIVSGATVLSMLLGIVIGATAGYFGGWFDRLLLFAIDLFWSVPFAIFVVLAVSIVGVSPLSLILAIGGINWVTSARVIRTQTKALRVNNFVLVARAYGFNDIQIATQQLLPPLRRSIIVLAAYAGIETLTLETGLAFLGLDMPAPRPTWGGLLADGLSYYSSAPWLLAAAAIAVVGTLGSAQVLVRGSDIHTTERGE